MFVELHMIQNFAPANLNRDDTNAPKDCEFGGYRRARISSQCIKRAIRASDVFQTSLAKSLGKRSRLWGEELGKLLEERGKDGATAHRVARFFLQKLGLKEIRAGKTVLFFLGQDEAESARDALVEVWDDVTPLAETQHRRDELVHKIQELLADETELAISKDAAWLSPLLVDVAVGNGDWSVIEAWDGLERGEWLKVFTKLDGAEDYEKLRQSAEDDRLQEEEKQEEEGSKKRAKAPGLLKRMARDELKAIQPKTKTTRKSTAALPESLKEAIGSFKKTGTKAVDIALFGRMVAEIKDNSKNVDAACQVAHAISTHKVEMEFDFYTAVDDLQKKEDSGSAMMGTIEFNSSCFYRYANIDFKQLRWNLLGKKPEDATSEENTEASRLAMQAVEAFLRAAVAAVPTGKQNSMAAQNPPSFVLAVVRPHGLWSLANAFVKPVWPEAQKDLIQKSIERLDQYWNRLTSAYGGTGNGTAAPTVVFFQVHDAEVEYLKAGESEKQSLDELVEFVLGALAVSEEEAKT